MRSLNTYQPFLRIEVDFHWKFVFILMQNDQIKAHFQSTFNRRWEENVTQILTRNNALVDQKGKIVLIKKCILISFFSLSLYLSLWIECELLKIVLCILFEHTRCELMILNCLSFFFCSNCSILIIPIDA